MPIHIPHLMEPFNGTVEQWEAYLEQQKAGLDYATAYHDTIGIFALFSPKKNKALKSAQRHYHNKRDTYWQTLDVEPKSTEANK